MLGIALRGQRDEFVVATKFGGGQIDPADGARVAAHVEAAVEGSLRRLRTDHIDLYQLHLPDDVTPIEETLSALTDLVQRARCATSAPRTSPRGRSPTPTGPRARPGSSGSCPRRTATRCSTAGSRRSWSRRASRSAWACCRTSRWPTACSPASTGAARRRRRAPARRSTPAARSGWDADGTGSRPWRRTPRSAISLLDVAVAGLAAQPRWFGDLGRDERRPGARERRGVAVAAVDGGPGRAGRPERV